MTSLSTAAITSVTPRALAAWLQDGEEIALVDVSEAGQFGEHHLLLAVNIPWSRFELDLARRVPRRTTRLVLVSGDGTHAHIAAATAQTLGYTAVSVLQGGTAAWRDVGFKTFQGVNVPSKAFSEFVEHVYHTGDIESQDLLQRQQAGDDLILLDSRTLEEHRRFHVPGAISCPGSELVARFADLVPSPDTLVVVTCAGRTRGIIGAQTLIEAGVPNRVLALSGGTQGWRLAGLELERQPAQESAPASAAAQAIARNRVALLEARAGLERITLPGLQQWQADAGRTTFVFDIRTRAEYDEGHWPGAAWAQGVQLIQCFDEFVAVRNAHVVLVDTDGSRAILVAHWLKQLGAQVALFAPSTDAAPTAHIAKDHTDHVSEAPWQQIPVIDAATARSWVNSGAVVLDTGSSERFRQSHPQGAHWINRSAITAGVAARAAETGRAIVMGDDDNVARLVALSLRQLHPSLDIVVLPGGLSGWQHTGLPLAATPDTPPDAERIDYLFWLHDRHAGNAEASAAYLQWELDLPALVGNAHEAGYRFP